MAEYAYPTAAYNGRAVTSREYEDLTHPQAPDGLIGTPALPALIYADSTLRGYKIRASRAGLVRGHRWESGPVEMSVPVPANTTAGTTRIDLVVLRLTRNPWDVKVATVPGTALASPTAPAPTFNGDTAAGVWEIPLATVAVPYNAAVTDAGQCVPVAWYVENGQILCTSTTRPPAGWAPPGATLYETNTDLYRRWNGAAWVINIMPTAVVMGVDLPITGLAFVDTALAVPVQAGGTYKFSGDLFHKQTTTGRLSLRFTFPGGTLHWGGLLPDVSIASSIGSTEFRGRQFETSSPSTAIAVGSTSSGNGLFSQVAGTYVCTATGTLRLQAAQFAAQGITNILEGSNLLSSRIG